MEITGINPELNDMLDRGQLSGKKIKELIRLREMVDRYAQKGYVSDEARAELVEKFGVEPNILTWGDYFQTEVASNYWALSDEDFLAIVDTVRFDLISATKIFRGKPEGFRDRVRTIGWEVHSRPRDEWDAHDEEQAHLYILAQYYEDLDLEKATVPAEDEEWFQGFVHESKSAIG